MSHIVVFLASFIACASLSHFWTSLMLSRGFFQPIRNFGPDHQDKVGVVTMGGIAIIASVVIVTFLFVKSKILALWISAIFIGFGGIGLYDDLCKFRNNSHLGSKARSRLIAEFVMSGAFLFIFQHYIATDVQPSALHIPIINYDLYLPAIIYDGFRIFVVVSVVNATNLTDGLDGLASGVVTVICLFLAFIIFQLHSTGVLCLNLFDLSIPCIALAGSCIGFLWHNTKPAKIFMGDVGSLSLGGFIGMIVVCIRQELVFAIAATIFLAEVLSVIIQISSYRIYHRRVFLMAPIHHHFEKLGWKEERIVVRAWIISLISALIASLVFLY